MLMTKNKVGLFVLAVLTAVFIWLLFQDTAAKPNKPIDTLPEVPVAKQEVVEPAPDYPSPSDYTYELLYATNAERARYGRAAVSISLPLNASAQEKCEHMLSNNYWAHTAPDGTTWGFFMYKHYGLSSKGAENLWSYIYQLPGDKVVQNWMDSPTHRDALLENDYKETGYGICNSDKEVYIVQHLVAPL